LLARPRRSTVARRRAMRGAPSARAGSSGGRAATSGPGRHRREAGGLGQRARRHDHVRHWPSRLGRRLGASRCWGHSASSMRVGVTSATIPGIPSRVKCRGDHRSTGRARSGRPLRHPSRSRMTSRPTTPITPVQGPAPARMKRGVRALPRRVLGGVPGLPPRRGQRVRLLRARERRRLIGRSRQLAPVWAIPRRATARGVRCSSLVR